MQELNLALGDVPKWVVQLASADEHRENFSLTNINSSLRAGVGVELRLPGVHSDIGGSYAERDPANPDLDGSYLVPRQAPAEHPSYDPQTHALKKGRALPPPWSLNLEVRRVASTREQQQLIAQGWYLPGQFVRQPVPYGEQVAAAYGQALVGASFGAPLPPPQGPLAGVRYLTNEYQYVTLRIMHDFALGQHGGGHEPMDLHDFADDFAAYQVPPVLEETARYLEKEAGSGRGRTPTTPEQDNEQDEQGRLKYPHGKPPEQLELANEAHTHWLRNRYLHRSAKQKGDFEPLGMETRVAELRLIIPDDQPDYVPPSLRPGYHPPQLAGVPPA